MWSRYFPDASLQHYSYPILLNIKTFYMSDLTTLIYAKLRICARMLHLTSNGTILVTCKKVKPSHKKSWRLREGMECWASILTSTFSTTRTTELAVYAHCTLPQGYIWILNIESWPVLMEYLMLLHLHCCVSCTISAWLYLSVYPMYTFPHDFVAPWKWFFGNQNMLEFVV
jgi:hypothetical protein